MRTRDQILMAVLAIFATGCSHAGGPRAGTAAPPEFSPFIFEGEAAAPVRNDAWIVAGVPLENSKFDFPVVVNPMVERWVEYFTGRGRDQFEKYLIRSEYFIPYIRPVLVEHGLPQDFVYLAMIESGFHSHARSRARAVGPWQFIEPTGARYGLKVNWWVDERRDIEKSTLAAIRYLADNYRLFGSWELAAAGYNAGESKIGRAVRRFGTTDFWAIARHRFLKTETRNYVPKMMAAAIIDKNRALFGFQPSYSGIPPVEAGVAEETAVEAVSAVPHVSRSGQVAGERLVEVGVQTPADLFKIAEAAGLDYDAVKRINPEVLRWCTPPGPEIYPIKLPERVKDQFVRAYHDPTFDRTVKFRSYKVRAGDTLDRIARRFGIGSQPILDLNGMGSKRSLRLGMTILLPIPGDRYRSLASLDLFEAPIRKASFRSKSQRQKYYRVTYQRKGS